MRYKCSLSVECDPKEMRALFEPENTPRGRTELGLITQPKGVRFELKSSDAVALRAALNSIAKLLAVWEAAKNGIRPRRSGKA